MIKGCLVAALLSAAPLPTAIAEATGTTSTSAPPPFASTTGVSKGVTVNTGAASLEPPSKEERQKLHLDAAIRSVALQVNPSVRSPHAARLNPSTTVPNCGAFNACVTGGGGLGECCQNHVDGLLRTCGLCAKAACILRVDFCAAGTGPTSDGYCSLCDYIGTALAHQANQKKLDTPAKAAAAAARKNLPAKKPTPKASNGVRRGNAQPQRERVASV